MQNSKLLGCLGFLVGSVVVVVVGWMTFELIVGLLAGLRLDGVAALVDPLLLHEAGELLVIGFTILGIYVWVFRSPGLQHFARTTRGVFWLGAALNAVAFFTLPASARWSIWAAVLVILGIVVPLLLERLGGEQPPARA